MNISLSVLIPAYNEEANIKDALESVTRALEGITADYEIIVIDDGSRDRTVAAVEEVQRRDDKVKLARQGVNTGYGAAYAKGVSLATKDFVTVFPGDNDTAWESFRDLVRHTGEADLVSAYMSNPGSRELVRRVLSAAFVGLLNILFGLRVKYYNGCYIARRELLQRVRIRSTGLTALAECKVKLLKTGATLVEIPFEHRPREGGRSSALTLTSVRRVVRAVILLVKDVYWGKDIK